jgi:hypothetical protein
MSKKTFFKIFLTIFIICYSVKTAYYWLHAKAFDIKSYHMSLLAEESNHEVDWTAYVGEVEAKYFHATNYITVQSVKGKRFIRVYSAKDNFWKKDRIDLVQSKTFPYDAEVDDFTTALEGVGTEYPEKIEQGFIDIDYYGKAYIISLQDFKL